MYLSFSFLSSSFSVAIIFLRLVSLSACFLVYNPRFYVCTKEDGIQPSSPEDTFFARLQSSPPSRISSESPFLKPMWEGERLCQKLKCFTVGEEKETH